MRLSRRKTLTLIGGGVIAAASTAGFAVTRTPRTALSPWGDAGGDADIRRYALSYALLAPNPHNQQPWLVDLREPDVVTLYADPARLLPVTDPFNRQITIGLGCFLELMRMAAAERGVRADITLFPDGEAAEALDDRPIARAVFTADATARPDPLFAHVLDRRSLKEPYDLERPVSPAAVSAMGKSVAAGVRFGGSVDPDSIADFRALTREAMRIEVETPHTFKESVDLFRIGRREVDANPDGIDFTGPTFETLHLTGLFTRESAMDATSSAYQAGLEAVYANTDTAMGHIWLVTAANGRRDQIAAGIDWVRVNLAATALGIATQPLSQALQEYPEMAALYADAHRRIAPEGGTVQMLARIGYGPSVPPSPRWPLDAKIAAA